MENIRTTPPCPASVKAGISKHFARAHGFRNIERVQSYGRITCTEQIVKDKVDRSYGPWFRSPDKHGKQMKTVSSSRKFRHLKFLQHQTSPADTVPVIAANNRIEISGGDSVACQYLRQMTSLLTRRILPCVSSTTIRVLNPSFRFSQGTLACALVGTNH